MGLDLGTCSSDMYFLAESPFRDCSNGFEHCHEMLYAANAEVFACKLSIL